MKDACRTHRDALWGWWEVGAPAPEQAAPSPVDDALQQHEAECEACVLWRRRVERQAAALRLLRRLPAPPALDGGVVAATQAGSRQDRAVDAVRALGRLDLPEVSAPTAESEPVWDEDASSAAEPLACLPPLSAPDSLLERVEGELAQPIETRLRRHLGGLPRRTAPAELERRLAVDEPWLPRDNPGFGATPWLMTAMASAALIVLASFLWSDRTIRGGESESLAFQIDRVAYLEGVSENAKLEPAQIETLLQASARSTVFGMLGALASAEPSAPAFDSDESPRQQSFPESYKKAPLDPYVLELLTRSETAALQQSYLGSRVVESRPLEGQLFGYPSSQVWVLRERVGSNGLGQYGFDSFDLIEPSLNPQQLNLYLELQELRQGMHFRYRDFRVRDVALLEQNYSAVYVGPTVVAERPCEQVRIHRVPVSDGHYLIDIDLEFGLVLRSEHKSETGDLLSRMEFESVDFRPDWSSLTFHDPLNDERVLPKNTDLLDYFGFQPLEPTMLPIGYEQVEQSAVYDVLMGSDWHKRTYSDGVEVLFFLHGGAHDPLFGGDRTWPGANDFVRLVVAAEWSALQGNVKEERVLAMGRMLQSELIALVASALP